jgi:predicted short-subunit dehydrogenase-like oxidoreductase (DUF2520 family)
MLNSIKNIAFAGAGNLAWHLAHGLKKQGYTISGVWSREPANALALAESCETDVCREVSALREGADMIVIAVPDKAIENIARSIGNFDGMVVHTAGSVSVDVFAGIFEQYGVLYPLQTFSREIPLELDKVPFFVESSSSEGLSAIKRVALKLSRKVYETDSQQRLLLHVAAVFAGNYSNLMYIIGNELLKNCDLPPEVLHPLLSETVRKAVAGDPLKMQTGPARRNDTITIEKHMKALALQPEYAEVYRLLSQLISKKYH